MKALMDVRDGVEVLKLVPESTMDACRLGFLNGTGLLDNLRLTISPGEDSLLSVSFPITSICEALIKGRLG